MKERKRFERASAGKCSKVPKNFCQDWANLTWKIRRQVTWGYHQQRGWTSNLADVNPGSQISNLNECLICAASIVAGYGVAMAAYVLMFMAT